MLRITPLNHAPTVLLRLEGKLTGLWIRELRLAFDHARRDGRPVRLDLFAVSFVDRTGIELLRELLDRGARIEACSTFVSELLHLEKP